MKKLLMFLCIISIVLIMPLASFAGVGGSLHDMTMWFNNDGMIMKKGSCSFCHIPHNAIGDRLWVEGTRHVTGSEFEPSRMSRLCLSCHGPNPDIAPDDGQQLNVYAAGSHGRNSTFLWNGMLDTTGSEEVDIASSAVLNAIINEDDDDALLKCTSCHNVHNNDVKPFLAKLDPTMAQDQFTKFCVVCHANRKNSSQFGDDNPGTHPAGIAYLDANDPDDSPLQPTIAGAFNVSTNTTIAQEFVGQPMIQRVKWNLGGHLEPGNVIGCATCHAVHSNETTGFTNDDGATPVTTLGGAIPPKGGPVQETSLTGTSTNRLLTIDYYARSTVVGEEAYTYLAVCEGCHMNEWPAAFKLNSNGGVYHQKSGTPIFHEGPGPGNATTHSHPIGSRTWEWRWFVNYNGTYGYQYVPDSVATGAALEQFDYATATPPLPVVSTNTPSSDYTVSTGYALICTSCHDIHLSSQDDFLLHAACNECHNHVAPLDHHPSNDNPVWDGKMETNLVGGVNYVLDACWIPRDMPDNTHYTNWATYQQVGKVYGNTTTQYKFTDNKMLCTTCHLGDDAGAVADTAYINEDDDFNCVACHGTAHNGFAAVRLVGKHQYSDMCVDCHGFNPSDYTKAFRCATTTYDVCGAESACNLNATFNDRRIADHYVGPISDGKGGAYVQHVSTTANPSNYCVTGVDSPWSTGMCSRYKTIAPDCSNTNGCIICESCHTTALPVQDTGLGKSENTVMENGDPKAQVKLLLENSGNDSDINATAGGVGDLCTGCHGLNPGSGVGSTHKVQGQSVAWGGQLMIGETFYYPASAIDAGCGPVSGFNTATQINCESCHRPHDASEFAGGLILEASCQGPAWDANDIPTAKIQPSSTTPTAEVQRRMRLVDNWASLPGHLDESPECDLCHGLKDK